MLRKNLKVIAIIFAIALTLSGCGPSTHVDTVSPTQEEIEEVTSDSSEESIEKESNETSKEETESIESEGADAALGDNKGEDEEQSNKETPKTESKSEPSQPQTSEQPTAQEPEQSTKVEEPATPTDETASVQTSTVTVSGTYHYEEAKKVLSLVNNYRKENGLGELTWDESMASAAKTRAAEASICWSHTRPNGTAWYTVSSIVKGENLAKGYATAEEAFNAWLASDGHRENILWSEFNTMYVAFFEAENGWFWAQEFGY